MQTPQRPMPDDFPQVAARMTSRQMIAHYRTGYKQIARWLAEVNAKPASVEEPPPADFAKVAPTMFKRDLRAHYGVGHDKITRWLKEAGVKSKPPTPCSRWKAAPFVSVNGNRSSWTVHDRAVDVLRRERFAVFRCDERGRFDHHGKLWRVGNVVCDGDELLARAARYEAKAA